MTMDLKYSVTKGLHCNLPLFSSTRFFIVRDGWLFYYPDTEKKEFARRTVFNTHPKVRLRLLLPKNPMFLDLSLRGAQWLSVKSA